ncbi:hypothetical protein KC19_VG319500, partial [Ceratodon purpureus]
MLQRDGLFTYCITPPSAHMSETERLGRESALAAINNNAKNTTLRLLKRKSDSVSIDLFLTEVKEVVDLLEELDLELPEPIVVYWTVQNLP